MTTLAVETLTEALAIAERRSDPARAAAVHDSLGLAYRAQGRFERAFELLEAGLDDARAAGRKDLEATILNDTGVAWALSGQVGPAAVAFERAASMAAEIGLRDLQATACINNARFFVDQGELSGIAERLEGCSAIVDGLGPARQRAAHLTAIGTVYSHGQRHHGAPADWRLRAFDAFEAGRRAARESGDGRSESVRARIHRRARRGRGPERGSAPLQSPGRLPGPGQRRARGAVPVAVADRARPARPGRHAGRDRRLPPIDRNAQPDQGQSGGRLDRHLQGAGRAGVLRTRRPAAGARRNRRGPGDRGARSPRRAGDH